MSKKDLEKLANDIEKGLSKEYRAEIDSNNIVFTYNESIIKREINDELSLLKKEFPLIANISINDADINRISKEAVAELNKVFLSSKSIYLSKDRTERQAQINQGKIFLSGEGSTFDAITRLIKPVKKKVLEDVENLLSLKFKDLEKSKNPTANSSYTIQFLNIEHVYSVSDLRMANVFLQSKGSKRKTINFLNKLKENSSNLVREIIDDYILTIVSKVSDNNQTSLKKVTLELEWKSERRNKEVGREQIKARKRALFKYIELLLYKQIKHRKTLNTSDSIEELYAKKIINNLDSSLPRSRKIRKKLNNEKIKPGVSKVKNSFGVASKIKSKKGATMGALGISAPKVTESRFSEPEEIGPSPLQVLNYINSKLPGTIEKNMEFPRLEYQTGRFARSVEAVNMQQTRQGFPSIAYTYQRNPYQVFEMGLGRFPWATPERDPRKLIDRSIREIAAEMLKTRIYTRRI